MNREYKTTMASASARWLCVGIVILTCCALTSTSWAAGKVITHNTPSYIATAKNLGAEDPAKVIDVSIWLQMHNRSQFDALAHSLYDRKSSNYHHWLTPKQIAAQYGPTKQEARSVRQFFRAHNLQVVKTGPNNFYVRGRGTVGDVEKAFHVQLNNYQVGSDVMRANNSDPSVEGEAGKLVAAVSGLDSGKYNHPLSARPTSFGSGKSAAAMRAPSAVAPDLFSSQCFPGTETETITTNNNGSLPAVTITGNVLNLQTTTSPGCAYLPPSIATAYNLNGLYAEGYTGAGQTIAIVDWCGSATITDDANAFSAAFGLPTTSTGWNFNIIYTAPSFCIAWDQVEINLDVEWAHAIAPGAAVNLVVPPSANFTDVNEAEFQVINLGLGNVLSGSYGSIEAFTPQSELDIQNLLSEMGAVTGISMNYATGDTGDFSVFGIAPTVLSPADSPWSTAVGGVSLALNPDNTIAWQAGWGNNETLFAETGSVFDPPIMFGFNGGGGGGMTNCAVQDINFNCLAGFPKPSYQKKIGGKYRQMPDVSWLADPFTGAAILISLPGNVPPQTWQVWGGTSLATPMFSGIWAIANEEAVAGGGTELGQAAPYMYSLPAGAVFDIVPVKSKHNVTASIQDSSGTTAYNANAVMGGAAPSSFVSAIWDYGFLQFTALAISFNTDCATLPATFFDGTPCNATGTQVLKTKAGWDNVTGVGSPNGQAFADSFFGK